MSIVHIVGLSGARDMVATCDVRLGRAVRNDLDALWMPFTANREGEPGRRAYEAFIAAFEAGVLVRTTGDIIALSPPLISRRRLTI